MPQDIQDAIDNVARRHEASELVRQYQQGYGRPIITAELNGARIVAVSKRVKWSVRWRWFTDFLLDHLKDTLGRDWGTEAQRRKLDHPVFRWLARMNSVVRSDDGSGNVQHEATGFVTSIFRLGYALYLIEHHDQLDVSLVARLRRPAAFHAAYYETLIAAAFAVAGAKIRMAEHRGQSTKTPEFWAIGQSGRKYAVEAKCKASWRSPIDPDSAEFRAELRQWIRDQIYRASSKRLQNAVFCFELSIPACFGRDTWEQIQQLVRDALTEAESMTVGGQPTAPAYVIVTNHAHLVDDDSAGLDQIAMLDGYKLESFQPGIEVPLETALEWHDENRDIIWLVRSMEEVERVPSTFDGRLPQFLAAQGAGEHVLHIGETIQVEAPDGKVLRGKLHDIVSLHDKAHVVIETPDGRHSITQIPLTPTEADAARAYGDAVFGKPQKRQRKLKDITELYDWFLEVYEKYDKDALLRQIPNHFEREQIGELPLDKMRVRVAREVTKAAYQHTNKSKDTTGPLVAETSQ